MIRQIIVFLASHLLDLLLLEMGLTILRRHERWDRPLVLKCLFVAAFAVPSIAFLSTKIFSLGPIAAQAILLMSISPGSPFVLFSVSRKHSANLNTALVLTHSLTLLALLLLPVGIFLFNRFTPFQFHAEPLNLIKKALFPLLFPFSVGAILKIALPDLAAKLAPWVDRLFKLSLLAIVVVLLAISIPALKEVPIQTFLAMAIVTTGAAWAGDWAARGRPYSERFVAASAVTLGNPALAFYVIRESYPGEAHKLMMAVCLYLLLRALWLIPYRAWNKAKTASIESKIA